MSAASLATYTSAPWVELLPLWPSSTQTVGISGPLSVIEQWFSVEGSAAFADRHHRRYHQDGDHGAEAIWGLLRDLDHLLDSLVRAQRDASNTRRRS